MVLPMLDAMGKGWAYTFVGLVQLALIPLQLAIIKWGPVWRERQWRRDEKKRAEKEGKEEAKVEAGQDMLLVAQKGDHEKDVEKA